MNRWLAWTLTVAFAIAGSACRDAKEFKPRDNTAEREAFYERYNKETLERIEKEREALVEALAGDLEEGARLEKEQLLADTDRRLERPDYFEILEEADLPQGMVWETAMDLPEIGSAEAEKGGTFHSYIPGGAYPPTIRSCGKEGNNSFRSFHWDDIELGLVSVHPNSGDVMPALADRWAVAEDGQSVYFHIDDEATWSDGREVTSGDWLMSFYVYLSPYLTEAFYKIYYAEQFWGISTYGKDYLCIRIAYPKPMAPYFANVAPFQEAFYREFGPDFEDRYNWRPRPTTGAYVIREEDILKGRSIALSRVKDWWAKDRKYYKYRFNPDRLVYSQIRDDEKIFQLFLRGDIDLFMLNDPKRWYEQTEVDSVFNGYIERATFYNEYPRVSRGLYFNLSRPVLSDLDVRVGLAHATNWEKVIELDLRGDAERLNLLNEGFGDISNPHIRAREFSVEKAREAFARAGFTEAGDDGILRNAEGRRLSFTVNHVKHPVLDPMMLRLKEEARLAGVEYKLEGMDATASFQKTTRKEHEIAFAGWGITPPFPDFYQQFHSKEAYVPGTTTPRPMTNNINVFADFDVDPILEENRNARSREAIVRTTHELEEIFHDEAVWAPAYMRPFYRLGFWRWVRWPDDFNVKIADLPEMSHVHWIDQTIKEETLEAIRTGRTFEEKNLIYDQYRRQIEVPVPEVIDEVDTELVEPVEGEEHEEDVEMKEEDEEAHNAVEEPKSTEEE